MVITRRLPKSNVARQRALNRAALKNGTLTPADQVLNSQTSTRLTDANTDYDAAMVQVEVAQVALSANTDLKAPLMAECKLFAGHFIQVFNLGVARGKYAASARPFFGLEVDSNALPPMISEEDVLFYAGKVVTGDALRMAPGTAQPMANPDASEVNAVHAPAVAAYTQQTVLKTAFDASQNALSALNDETDKVIKRVWDEVETFYGEGTIENRRNNARQWGVVYVTEGPAAILTGLVKDAAGNPREGAEVEVVETGAKALTNAEGRYTLLTTVIGTATLLVTYPGQTDATHEVEIPDHEGELTIEVEDIII